MKGGMRMRDGDGQGGAEDRFRPGGRVGPYTIVYGLGRGEMAVVYRARDESLPRPVALKVIAPRYAADAEFRRRFLDEGSAIAQVDEPHILPVYEAGETGDGVLYLAAKLVSGGDLGAIVREEGTLAPGRVGLIVTQAAAALDAAHARDIVHRDVKPTNILLDSGPGRDEHAYLADYGITRITQGEQGQNEPSRLLGTPAYMAPEQAENLPVSERTDQYGLACTAFELLTGSAPYRHGNPVATMRAQVHDPIPAATIRRPDLPPAVDAVLARGMAKAQGDRYRSCGEFATALRRALNQGAVQPATALPAGATQSRGDVQAPDRLPAPDGVQAPGEQQPPDGGPVTSGRDPVALLRRHQVSLIVAIAVLAAILLTLVMAPGGRPRHTPLPSPTPAGSASTIPSRAP